MTRKNLPHLAVVAVVLVLLLAVLLIRRHAPEGAAVSVGTFSAETRVSPPKVPPTPSSSPGPAVAKQAEDYADPNEVVDPARVLRGELLVRVLTTDGKAIAGAEVIPSLSTNAFDGEEGILSDHLMGGGSWTSIRGKNALFRGEMRTNADGESVIQIFLPRKDKYLNGHIEVRVEAPLMVRRKHQGQLRLPKEGERKEITFRLAPGQIVRGKILNFEEDDARPLMAVLQLPGEEKTDDKTWIGVAHPNPDGTFEFEPGPLVPLKLQITHNRRKFLPYEQLLQPPVQGVLEIVLQRDATFNEVGRALFTILNPPPKGEFSHVLKIYVESEKRLIGITANHSELSEKMRLKGGAYRVLLCSWDQDVPMWAHAAFTVTDTGTTEVPLTLEKAATLRVRIKEKATGAAVAGKDPPSLDLEYKFGDKYESLYGLVTGYGKSKTAVAGESLFVTIPPGSLRLVVSDEFKGRYKECPQVVTLASGESQTLDFLLEPAPEERDQ